MAIKLFNRPISTLWGAVLLLSVLGFLVAVFNYFWTGNGIHGTEGALLVIVSTLLLIVGTALLAARVTTGFVAGLLMALLLLDFVGTGLAAWLLEAWILLALDILAAIAWFATFANSSKLSTAS